MASSLISPRWAYRGLYLLLALAVILMRLLPLQGTPVQVPGPDILVCFTFAWLLRRPDYLPPLLIGMVFFFADFVLMRPPGLWALIVLLGSEFLRGREATIRELGFAAEWGMVSAVMAAMLIADRLGYLVAFLAQPPIPLSIMQLLATIIAYPAVAAASHYGFGISRPGRGGDNGFGRRM